jgi:hypothetical protein
MPRIRHKHLLNKTNPLVFDHPFGLVRSSVAFTASADPNSGGVADRFQHDINDFIICGPSCSALSVARIVQVLGLQ